jgi:hypothetical protein
VVVIDEAHVFIDTKFPVALDFMFQLAKRIRKYNGMQIVITQNIKDFVGSEEIARKSTAIINACQYSFIFALSPNDIDDLCKLYEKAGGINESEQEQITTAPRGQTFAIMSPASRSTFRIEVPDSVVQMFRQPDYVSQYFVGYLGDQYWEDFIGTTKLTRLENKLRALDEEVQETPQQQRKAINFVELDEDEIQAQVMEEAVTVVEEVAPIPVEQEPHPEPVQQVVQVVQTTSVGDTTAQQLAQILGNFSFDAIRSEINYKFEQLRRDLEEQSIAQAKERAATVETPVTTTVETPVEATVAPVEVETVAPVEVETVAPAEVETATTATFQIETAKIPAPVQETVSAAKTDYSSLIMPEDDETDDSQQEASGGIDIMALLSAQAKKMESISTIEMMEVYGEAFSEVTLEELEKYINKKYR